MATKEWPMPVAQNEDSGDVDGGVWDATAEAWLPKPDGVYQPGSAPVIPKTWCPGEPDPEVDADFAEVEPEPPISTARSLWASLDAYLNFLVDQRSDLNRKIAQVDQAKSSLKVIIDWEQKS
jgi:hypothetical protein